MSQVDALKIEQIDVEDPWGGCLKLQVFDDAETADTTFLCVHGYMDNSNSFLPLAQCVAKKTTNKYCLIAIDMPGQGLSSHLPNPLMYGFRAFVLALRCVVTHLKLSHYVLVGHSLGCLISLAVSRIFCVIFHNST